MMPGLLHLRRYAIHFLLACSVVAVVAAFSNRAVYIDENLFLSVARMDRDWGVFPNGEWFFFGTAAPLATYTHSPFGGYCLALLLAIFGGFEVQAFRLLFGCVFSMVAVLSFYGLARRMANHPGLLALLFITSPAFFVFAPTLMMDVPMLALMLAGLYAYLKATEGSIAGLFTATLCFTVSVAFGYAALVLLVSFFVAAWLKRRPMRELAALAAPFGAFVIWAIVLTLHYGELPFMKTAQHFASAGSIGKNVLATPSFLGGATVFPWLFLLLSFLRERRATFRIAVVSITSALLLSFFVGWITYRYGFWYIFLASGGIALILLFARDIRGLLKTRGVLEGFVAIGFPAVLLFFIVVGEFITARYLLLGLPWLYLALFRRADKKQLAPLIGATLALSIAVAVADYRFVRAYRDWVTENVTPVERPDFHVWNSGESGLRFYLEESGASTLSYVDTRPRGGDLVVRQKMFRYSLPERVETMLVTLKAWELTDWFPLRTFNQEAGAGFHGSGLGMVPFAVSRRPYDVVEIAQITPLAQAQPAAVWSERGPLLIQNDPVMTVLVKVPAHTRIEYELDGQGAVVITDGFMTLRKEQPGPIQWRNFRLVPEALLRGQ